MRRVGLGGYPGCAIDPCLLGSLWHGDRPAGLAPGRGRLWLLLLSFFKTVGVIDFWFCLRVPGRWGVRAIRRDNIPETAALERVLGDSNPETDLTLRRKGGRRGMRVGANERGMRAGAR